MQYIDITVMLYKAVNIYIHGAVEQYGLYQHSIAATAAGITQQQKRNHIAKHIILTR